MTVCGQLKYLMAPYTVMQCFMRMMHEQHDIKVVLSTHCHAMHQFTLPVQSDKIKMASSGLDTDDYIAIALALESRQEEAQKTV